MINVLMCVYKSGDVLPITLKQLIAEPAITRILIADGPHKGPIKPGAKIDTPTVKDVVDELDSKKIFYEYTDDCQTRSMKNNHILPNAHKCKWILTVDSDEVYHEKGLERLAKFLGKNQKYDRYMIKTIDPYRDFFHEIRIPDWKPRLYSYKPGYVCPASDRAHQYVVGPGQRVDQEAPHGMTKLDPEICRIYHLNALRHAERMRVEERNGIVIWKGGNQKFKSKIYDLKKEHIPKSVLDLDRATL